MQVINTKIHDYVYHNMLVSKIFIVEYFENIDLHVPNVQ